MESASDHLSKTIPWYNSPPDGEHAEVAQAIIDLWLENEDLGVSVAELTWVADEISRPEASAINSLRSIGLKDVGLAERVVGYLWVSDGVTAVEAGAVEKLAGLANRDLSAAEFVAELPKVSYGGEARGPEKLALVAQLHWVLDGLTETEKSVVFSLATLVDADPELAEIVARHGLAGRRH